MKLTLDLDIDSALAIALRRRAHWRGITNEAAAIEILTMTLEATGEIEARFAGWPELRSVKPEGNA